MPFHGFGLPTTSTLSSRSFIISADLFEPQQSGVTHAPTLIAIFRPAWLSIGKPLRPSAAETRDKVTLFRSSQSG